MRSNFVSLHPYFRAHPGQIEAAKAAFLQLVEKTATEKENLFYGFTVNGDERRPRPTSTSTAGGL
jgi:quinol monooxygenase YgiN